MDFLSLILGIVVFGGLLYFLWRGMSATNKQLDDSSRRTASSDMTGRSSETRSGPD